MLPIYKYQKRYTIACASVEKLNQLESIGVLHLLLDGFRATFHPRGAAGGCARQKLKDLLVASEKTELVAVGVIANE